MVSDHLQSKDAELSVEVMDFSGQIIQSEKFEVEIPANTSMILAKLERPVLLQARSGKEVFVTVRLTSGELVIDEKNVYRCV